MSYETDFILAGSPGAPRTGHCACEGGTGWTHHCGDCKNAPPENSIQYNLVHDEHKDHRVTAYLDDTGLHLLNMYRDTLAIKNGGVRVSTSDAIGIMIREHFQLPDDQPRTMV